MKLRSYWHESRAKQRLDPFINAMMESEQYQNILAASWQQ